MPRIRRNSSIRRAIGWTATWILLLILWFLFVGSVSVSEIVAGALAAAVGATAADAIRRRELISFRPDPRWMVRAWRLPFRAILDVPIVLGALVLHLIGRKRIRSTFRAVPYPVGGADARSSSRRAIAAAAGSLAPNGFIVGYDGERGLMLVHELVPRAPTSGTERLVRPG